VLYERDEENIACFIQLAGVSSFAQLSIGVRIGPPPPPRTRPQCAGATWIVPRYDGGQLFARYWNGDRGRRSTIIVGTTTAIAMSATITTGNTEGRTRET